MKKKLVFYGAAFSAKNWIFDYNKGKYPDFDLIGLIDDDDRKKRDLDGVHILGNRTILPELLSQGIDHIIVSLLGDSVKRLETCLELEKLGFKFPSMVPPLIRENLHCSGVYVDESVKFLGLPAKLGDFCVVGPFGCIEGGVSIGKGVILRPYVFVGYSVEIGDGTIVNPGASITPKHKVGRECEIGYHVVVHRDIPDNTKFFRYENKNTHAATRGNEY